MAKKKSSEAAASPPSQNGKHLARWKLTWEAGSHLQAAAGVATACQFCEVEGVTEANGKIANLREPLELIGLAIGAHGTSVATITAGKHSQCLQLINRLSAAHVHAELMK